MHENSYIAYKAFSSYTKHCIIISAHTNEEDNNIRS